MSKKPRAFSREFKRMVVRRLPAGEKMRVVAQWAKVLRKDLYIWRDRYRTGRAEALRGCGRPRRGEALVITKPRASAGGCGVARRLPVHC